MLASPLLVPIHALSGHLIRSRAGGSSLSSKASGAERRTRTATDGQNRGFPSRR
jgi:hypothetical protein